MRLSANLGFLWPDRPLLERIDAAAAVGFAGVELHWPYNVPAAAVRARCAAHGLTLLALNTPRGDPARGEFGLGCLPGREAECDAALDAAIRYAVEAGAGAVHCLAGRIEPSERDAARRTMVDTLRRASARAAPHGLTLLIEALNPRDAPDYLYDTIADAAAVLAQADCPNVKLLFDGYHIGQEKEGPDEVATKLARHLPAIGHVQIASVPSRAEPDEGTLDYRALLQRLAGLGYLGWVGAEYRPRAGTDDGLSWMRSIWPGGAAHEAARP